MNCVDEIVNRLMIGGVFSEDALRIILNDYDITKKSREIMIPDEDVWKKAIQMFIVTKKVEGCTDNTIKYYISVLKTFYRVIDCPLKEVTADRIRYYLAIRSSKDKISKVSQDNELRVIKSFFKWCTGEEYVVKNPALNIKSIKKEKRIKKPFSETEMELLRRKVTNLRDRAILETLYSTGCRVSELCGMNREDVNGDEIIVFGKGEKERMVYLNAKAILSLNEYLATRKDNNPALFVQTRNPHDRLSKSGVEVIVRNLGESAGVKNTHPHRFRRTAATDALNRGMPLEQVSKMLGHEDLETTTLYARSEEENVKASHRKYVV